MACIGLYVCTSVDPNNAKMYLLFPVASEETTAAPGEETTAAPPGKSSNALLAKNLEDFNFVQKKCSKILPSEILREARGELGHSFGS